MKKEYELLNNVEIDLSEYKEETMDELEKKRMFKKFKNSKKKRVLNKKVVAVAVVLFLTINIGMHSEVVSAAMDEFKNNVSSFLGIRNNENYSSEIGETIKSGDVEIALNEFFTDNSRIVINMDINKDINTLMEEKINLIPDLYVNGYKVDIKSGDENNSKYGYSMRPKDENDTFKATSIVISIEPEGLNLTEKADVKLVFSNIAKVNGIEEDKFTYAFEFDINNYKNDTKVLDVNKKIEVEENKLEVNQVIIAPDRVTLVGSEDGFAAWESTEKTKYHYDIIDQNGEAAPLKASIRDGAYFYNGEKRITSIKIIPYTYDEIETSTTALEWDGRTKYILEDKIIEINLQ
ncbi:MAG: DUF4179 domain-containing protein [Clostridium sp.]